MRLPIEIQKEQGIPLYVQIEEQIRLLIHVGRLKPGSAMPTVRELAVDLSINANTVSRVYQDLQRAGVLELRRGIGTFVAERLPTPPAKPKDFEKIHGKVRELVALSRLAGVRPRELFQLIEITWKEDANE